MQAEERARIRSQRGKRGERKSPLGSPARRAPHGHWHHKMTRPESTQGPCLGQQPNGHLTVQLAPGILYQTLGITQLNPLTLEMYAPHLPTTLPFLPGEPKGHLLLRGLPRVRRGTSITELTQCIQITYLLLHTTCELLESRGCATCVHSSQQGVEDQEGKQLTARITVTTNSY